MREGQWEEEQQLKYKNVFIYTTLLPSKYFLNQNKFKHVAQTSLSQTTSPGVSSSSPGSLEKLGSHSQNSPHVTDSRGRVVQPESFQ